MESNLNALQYFDLPALQTAYFCDVKPQTNIGAIITSFTLRSPGPLQRLHIDGRSLCFTELISMLEILGKTLVEFELVVERLHNCGCAGALNEMFDRMSGVWVGQFAGQQTPVLLPVLKSLRVEIGASSETVDWDAVNRVAIVRGLICGDEGGWSGTDQGQHVVRMQHLCVHQNERSTTDGPLQKNMLAASYFLWEVRAFI